MLYLSPGYSCLIVMVVSKKLKTPKYTPDVESGAPCHGGSSGVMMGEAHPQIRPRLG